MRAGALVQHLHLVLPQSRSASVCLAVTASAPRAQTDAALRSRRAERRAALRCVCACVHISLLGARAL